MGVLDADWGSNYIRLCRESRRRSALWVRGLLFFVWRKSEVVSSCSEFWFVKTMARREGKVPVWTI